MSKLRWWRTISLVAVICAFAVIGSPAETFTTLLSFNGTDGQYPDGTLVQGLNGNFYGTTSQGGANGEGTVFEVSATGELTTLYSFCSRPDCTDGSGPDPGGLVEATNGNFYGTTSGGGSHGYGTVFEISAAGELTTLYSFCSQRDCTDGHNPNGLTIGSNGNLYGTTAVGGANGNGTVFEVSGAGELTTLYSFCSQPDCTDGTIPTAGVVEATNGNFYGTTSEGGAYGHGTVFKITPGAKLTTLYSFCSQVNCADGVSPNAGLIQATNGNFYGTTSGNGDLEAGAYSNGTIFEITAGGKLTTLYTFCSQPDCIDGQAPYAGLVEATNGNFYGTTLGGGAYVDCNGSSCGTVFEITAGGKLNTLFSFDGSDGEFPTTGLVQATNGNFYGLGSGGGVGSSCLTTGVGGCGTVFRLVVGLGPFVEALPASGNIGAAVIILGNNLTGATSVNFNGTPAKFRVVSSTEITTTVPSGATTGLLKVTTPSRTLTSNVKFRVS
jgi:uncharacterized repeat protein (TIGR03803 family)